MQQENLRQLRSAPPDALRSRSRRGAISLFGLNLGQTCKTHNQFASAKTLL